MTLGLKPRQVCIMLGKHLPLSYTPSTNCVFLNIRLSFCFLGCHELALYTSYVTSWILMQITPPIQFSDLFFLFL